MHKGLESSAEEQPATHLEFQRPEVQRRCFLFEAPTGEAKSCTTDCCCVFLHLLFYVVWMTKKLQSLNAAVVNLFP